MNKETELKKKGFIDIEVSRDTDLVSEIEVLKKEKNAVILAHFYQPGEVQDIADFIGDSLKLSQQAAATQADMIVFAGVHFMAETAKTLSPQKKVLLPDLNAGCSLADSCPPDAFEEFVKQHPDHTVISYVNTTTEIKALSDICCTSSNAKKIVENLPEEEKIIFAPDKNLGNYINSETGRNMLLWDGACHVHHEFSLNRIIALKEKHPEAKFIAHPECQSPVLAIADFVGSTSQLLKYTTNNSAQEFIVATDSGIIHQMRKAAPKKRFIAAPPEDGECACNDCNYMKLISLKKIYASLVYEMPEIKIDEALRKKAIKPIQRMLDISKKLGL